MPRGRSAAEPRLAVIAQPGRQPIYYICWHDGRAQRRLSTGTGDRGQADKIFARWTLDEESRKAGLPTGPGDPAATSVAHVLDVYAQHRAPKLVDPGRIGYAIKRLNPWWKNRHVAEVCPVLCEAYQAARIKDGASVGTIGRELGVLRAAVIWAVRNKYVSGPAPFVQLPPKQENKDRWLTRSEAARLLWAARKEPKSRHHLPLFIMLGLYTGARSEAILSLRWSQIDFVAGTIAFNPPGRQQTKKRRAKIRMPRRLRWFLAKVQARSTSATVLDWHGERIERIKHSFASAAKRAGLDDVTPHVLRHTCGTWLAQDGVPLWDIAGHLGHADLRTTNIYAHHDPQAQDRVLAVFDRPRERKRIA